MFCPRESCKSKLVSCIGADENGERFQCRVCTNEWYVKKPATIDCWPLPEWAKDHKGPARLPRKEWDDRPSREGFVLKKDDILVDDRLPRQKWKTAEELLAIKNPAAMSTDELALVLSDPLDIARASGRVDALQEVADYLIDQLKRLQDDLDEARAQGIASPDSIAFTRGANAHLALVLDLVKAKIKAG